MVMISRSTVRNAAFAVGFMMIGGLTTDAALAYQGHMQNALIDLHHARAELVASMDNKGGHRDAAISLVDQAMGQVHAGIAYAGN